MEGRRARRIRGPLAKLPREWERFGELQSQSDLHRPRAPCHAQAHPLAAAAKGSLVKDDHVAKVQRMRKSGSVPFQGVEPERIELWTGYANRLLPVPVRVGKNADNRLVVTNEDVGIACALLEFVGKKMNGDGTLPWARTKGLWDCLYQRGVVQPVVQRQAVCLDQAIPQRRRLGGRAGPDLRHRGTGGEVVAVSQVLENRRFS